jgi:hypothetical protein
MVTNPILCIKVREANENSPSTTQCCSEICSTQESPAESGSWFSSVRRRPSRSPFAMYRAGGDGRSSTSGSGAERPVQRPPQPSRTEARWIVANCLTRSAALAGLL